MSVIDDRGYAYHARMEQRTLKATLSPSRIADFNGCPLRFRYRNIDRLPERPGIEAFRGTVVHKVLEDLFDLPRHERTKEYALGDIQRAFEVEFAKNPDAKFAIDAELVWPGDERPAASTALESFLADLPRFISRYFEVEKPHTFEATHREQYVRGQLDEDLWLHGYVDRIDVAPTGEVRIVDYKTGKAPNFGYEDKALFQLKCYALLWQMERDTPVTLLQMLFLGGGEPLKYTPRPDESSRVRTTVQDLWAEMKRANERAEWQAKPSKLCDWCSFQAHCPAKGGTAIPFEPVPIELPKKR